MKFGNLQPRFDGGVIQRSADLTHSASHPLHVLAVYNNFRLPKPSLFRAPTYRLVEGKFPKRLHRNPID
jgi:hypothetical protein